MTSEFVFKTTLHKFDTESMFVHCCKNGLFNLASTYLQFYNISHECKQVALSEAIANEHKNVIQLVAKSLK